MVPIFIIHYKKLTERKNYLNSALEAEGFTDIHWFENIDRNTMTEEQLAQYQFDYDRWYKLNATWKQYDSTPRLLTKPEIACATTHISIYKYIVDHDIPIALIFEDDAQLLPNFKQNLQTVIDELPSNFDACYINDAFGWTINNFKGPTVGYLGSLNDNVKDDNRHVYKMNCSKCANAFLLSQKGAKLLYSNIIPFCLPIDWMHNPIYLTNNANVYWAEPPLTIEGSKTQSGASSVERDNKLQTTPLMDINWKELYDAPTKEQIEHYASFKKELKDDTYMFLEKFAKDRLIEFTHRVKTNDNFIISKMGDGECRNMISDDDSLHNCDNCRYYKPLGMDLIRSYIYFLNRPNVYINKWHSHTYSILNQMENDYSPHFDRERKFLFFDLLVQKIGPNGCFKQEQIDFFKTIKTSPRTKIYISNKAMIYALAPLLNISFGVMIPEVDAYLQKEQIMSSIKDVISKLPSKENNIFLFSAGMAGKVFLAETSIIFPNNTFIDIGSTFDSLVRFNSRDYNCFPEHKALLLKLYT